MPLPALDHPLLARLDALREAGWDIFERFELEVRDRRFHPFVAADYARVQQALIAHRAPGLRFLEWGSASGVITIMADLLGYEAYGIELDGALVDGAVTVVVVPVAHLRRPRMYGRVGVVRSEEHTSEL